MPYAIENGFVKIPEKDFERLIDKLEDALDRLALDAALRENKKRFPGELVQRMVEGEAPLRVFRQYRGLTQQALADAAKVSKTTISELETGRKDGSIKTIARIAEVLNLDIDDLV
ncbi:MAG: transcriptional regulator [Robiginitomaculum sp.]|nr:MAG: transcriptional regulator [Robiginitomaculum sp.]